MHQHLQQGNNPKLNTQALAVHYQWIEGIFCNLTPVYHRQYIRKQTLVTLMFLCPPHVDLYLTGFRWCMCQLGVSRQNRSLSRPQATESVFRRDSPVKKYIYLDFLGAAEYVATALRRRVSNGHAGC